MNEIIQSYTLTHCLVLWDGTNKSHDNRHRKNAKLKYQTIFAMKTILEGVVNYSSKNLLQHHV